MLCPSVPTTGNNWKRTSSAAITDSEVSSIGHRSRAKETSAAAIKANVAHI